MVGAAEEAAVVLMLPSVHTPTAEAGAGAEQATPQAQKGSADSEAAGAGGMDSMALYRQAAARGLGSISAAMLRPATLGTAAMVGDLVLRALTAVTQLRTHLFHILLRAEATALLDTP